MPGKNCEIAHGIKIYQLHAIVAFSIMSCTPCFTMLCQVLLSDVNCNNLFNISVAFKRYSLTLFIYVYRYFTIIVHNVLCTMLQFLHCYDASFID